MSMDLDKAIYNMSSRSLEKTICQVMAEAVDMKSCLCERAAANAEELAKYLTDNGVKSKVQSVDEVVEEDSYGDTSTTLRVVLHCIKGREEGFFLWEGWWDSYGEPNLDLLSLRKVKQVTKTVTTWEKK